MSTVQDVFPEWEAIFAETESQNSDDMQKAGGTLQSLIKNGLYSPSGERLSKPARHFSSILNQIVFSEFKTITSFDTLLAPFAHEDNLTYKEILQGLQGMVYAHLYLSKQKKQGTLRIIPDYACPESLKDKNAVVGGQELPYSYAACRREAEFISKALAEILEKGNSEGETFANIKLSGGAYGKNLVEESTLPDTISYEMFIKKGCKKCTPVKDFMTLSHMNGSEIKVDTDKGFDQASEKGVFTTPTVIFYKDNAENAAKDEFARAHNVQELESIFMLLRENSSSE